MRPYFMPERQNSSTSDLRIAAEMLKPHNKTLDLIMSRTGNVTARSLRIDMCRGLNMAKALWIGLLFLLWARIPAVTVETGSLRAFLYGEEPGSAYDNWISHLAEGIADENYNIYAPYDLQTTGFGDFHVADSTETNAWCAMLDQFLAGNFANAQNILTESELPFQIVEFYNTDNGRTLYMIRELPDFQYIDDNGTEDSYDDETGAFTYGWGLYIYDPASTRPIIVSVPHPCDDFPSPALACEAFELWNAKFLLIAGAGREVKWTNIGNYDNNKSISDPLIDLSVPGSVYGGNQACVKLIETGVLALYSGDADANGAVLPSDLNLYWRIQTGLIGYREADFDLDGAVLPSDLNLHWRLNTGLQSQIPLNRSK